ncbi:MAG: cation transporter [Clostridia bacterium]|nr:cation transporter [Clostridia bacterium]
MLRRKGVKIKVVIDGMCCDKCAKRAENTLTAVHGVVSADVKFSKGYGILRCTEEPSEDEIKVALDGVGFTLTSVEKIEQ